jgi:acetate kinase
MPKVPQVLVFDTAFHQTMPAKAYTYAIPYEMAQKYHIRRYGFHGTSHKFVSREMAKLLDKPVEETKIITCHIGNGSSISAVMGGKVIDTTMGFTPLDGVEMGTRSGAIDPAIVTFLMKKEGFTPDEMDSYLNKKCGFLGVSGVSSDSRDIEAGILEGNERCKLAAEVLAYQVKKYIGSFAAAMNGVDAVVFTAGMGENNTELRERVCTDMEFLGITLDKDLNTKTFRQSDNVMISTADSKVQVWVLPTNEELMIASDTEEIVSKL